MTGFIGIGSPRPTNIEINFGELMFQNSYQGWNPDLRVLLLVASV